ncbi:GNAT family N-acetyltransferase [Peribacillus acanthi]|uniref:GNAT family N-acetyltransferase n=1 Tax=Peribacillus acanthi TaxID=2171554 RepID=UPI000D3E9C45|nr:GNAT family N-acetyltransferase [Peribacillus acanthi]
MLTKFDFKNLLIKTNRLTIRPYQITDVDDIYEVVKEPSFYDFIPESPPSIKQVEGIVKWSIDCNEKNTLENILKLNLGIVHKDENCLIGYCGLGPFDLDTSKIELYYGIRKDFRGRGLATEAALSLIDFGFDTLNLNEIVTTVFPQNISSVKVLEKIGMKRQYSIVSPPDDFKEFDGMDFYSIHKM